MFAGSRCFPHEDLIIAVLLQQLNLSVLLGCGTCVAQCCFDAAPASYKNGCT
jgi:hypothetical protein